jgi:hypothetical protein
VSVEHRAALRSDLRLAQVLQAVGLHVAGPTDVLRALLLFALPGVVLLVSPERPAASVLGAAAYAAGAVVLTAPTRGDRWVIGSALIAAAVMALGLARVELWGHSSDAQLTYAAEKAVYFIAVVLPIASAVALLVRHPDDLRPIVASFLLVGLAIAFATVATRSSYLLGETRYTWQGNLIAVAVLLLFQGWLLRQYWLAVMLTLVGLVASFFIFSRQSLVAIGVGILATVLFWALARRFNPAGAPSRRYWQVPLALICLWGGLVGALLLVSAFRRADVYVPGFVPDAISCHCGLRHFNELVMGTSNGDANRLMLVHFATLLVSRHPLIGAGLGAFVGYLPLYEYPHNVALEVAAELGIPAALIVLGPMLAGFVLLLRRGVLEASSAVASLVMILIVFGVTANFAGDVASNRALWVFAGVALKLGVDALGLRMSSPID